MVIVVTMPAHNEEKTIGKVIDNIRYVMPEAIINVIGDHCTDKTLQIAAQHRAIIYKVKSKGLARAFEYEMKIALDCNPDLIIHIDSDNQYNTYDIYTMMGAMLKHKYDMIIGNRLWHKPDSMSISKYLGNIAGSLGYSIILGKHIHDITSGFRIFTPDIAKLGLNLNSQFTYTQELTYKAIKANKKVGFVNIEFNSRDNGTSRLMKSPLHYIRKSASDFRRFAFAKS